MKLKNRLYYSIIYYEGGVLAMYKLRITCKKCKSVQYKDIESVKLNIDNNKTTGSMTAVYIHKNICKNCKSEDTDYEIVNMDDEKMEAQYNG